jgi:hypothetical protein
MIVDNRFTLAIENPDDGGQGILQNCSSYDLEIDGSDFGFLTDQPQTYTNFFHPVIARNSWDTFSPVNSSNIPTSITLTVTGSAQTPTTCSSITLQSKTYPHYSIGIKISSNGSASLYTAIAAKSIKNSNVISITVGEKIAGSVFVLNCSGKSVRYEKPEGSVFPYFTAGESESLANNNADTFLFESVLLLDGYGSLNEQMFAETPSSYTFTLQ